MDTLYIFLEDHVNRDENDYIISIRLDLPLQTFVLFRFKLELNRREIKFQVKSVIKINIQIIFSFYPHRHLPLTDFARNLTAKLCVMIVNLPILSIPCRRSLGEGFKAVDFGDTQFF